MPRIPRSKFDTTHPSPVVQGVHKFLKRDNRNIRQQISLNAEEFYLLRDCAEKAGTTLSGFVRAASVFTAHLYADARAMRKVESEDE
jgi:hypothetical protein